MLVVKSAGEAIWCMVDVGDAAPSVLTLLDGEWMSSAVGFATGEVGPATPLKQSAAPAPKKKRSPKMRAAETCVWHTRLICFGTCVSIYGT
jgi:hypothetical protein